MAAKGKKTKVEPSLRTKLSQSYLEALEADFRLHGKAVIERMRERDPTRYAELAAKMIMTSEPPPDALDFSSANSMEEIGQRLLQSIGLAAPTEEEIEQALAENEKFVAGLEAIRAKAEGGIH
jgi:hypothetical protein